MIVNDQKQLIPRGSRTTFLSSYHGPLTIKWHQHIYDETAIDEKQLIHIL